MVKNVSEATKNIFFYFSQGLDEHTVDTRLRNSKCFVFRSHRDTMSPPNYFILSLYLKTIWVSPQWCITVDQPAPALHWRHTWNIRTQDSFFLWLCHFIINRFTSLVFNFIQFPTSLTRHVGRNVGSFSPLGSFSLLSDIRVKYSFKLHWHLVNTQQITQMMLT